MKNLTVGGLRAPGGFRGPRFQKFKKPRIQNDGPKLGFKICEGACKISGS